MTKIKVIAATGLVPVKALVAGITTAPGDIFGVTPQRVPSLLAKNEIALVVIGDDVETAEVDIRLGKTVNDSADDASEDEQFILPEGWRDLHHAKLIQMAKKLDANASTKAEAIAVLEAREASLKPAE